MCADVPFFDQLGLYDKQYISGCHDDGMKNQ